MRDHRTERPQCAAGLGGLLGVFALASTWWLASQAAQTWPGSGSTSVDAALLSVTLAAAALLLCWVSGVLTLAVVELLRGPGPGRGPFGQQGNDGVSGRREGLVLLERQLSATPATFTAVGRVSVLLLALTAVPAHAAPAGPPEPSWTWTSSDTVARSVSTPDPESESAEHPLLPDGSPVPLPGWTPVPVSAPVKPAATIGLVSVAP
ncbi:hypothetical protein [Ornithinimicrobium sufpigmenti]|uniref:hypothetical protein n=1 Tax=Ornithinimicrobium sufpigmenti TaxID=2508882 RepID=UPI001036CA69|nr:MULTISPECIES: hypothetical protein [unclassified Ornithinimicrobium]